MNTLRTSHSLMMVHPPATIWSFVGQQSFGLEA
jgi:hypothetical protein